MKNVNLACIIDDDPIFIFGTKRIMELANFCDQLLVYNNGKEAFEALSGKIEKNEDFPELILLDINMPIMDGWDFLDKLVQFEVSKPITIYIVSSSIDPADFDKAKEYSNVSNFIVKPITVDKLKYVLETFRIEN